MNWTAVEKVEKVNCLENEKSTPEEGKGAFACKTHENFRFEKVFINVGNVELFVLVDSGSECTRTICSDWYTYMKLLYSQTLTNLV